MKPKIEIRYQTYMKEVKKQLEEAKREMNRIPKLEELSNMTLEQFVEKYQHKYIE